jgi:aspartyl-tRNA(Asn)/glutamyl-tRNA(Gln) amidotransferase subunit A
MPSRFPGPADLISTRSRMLEGSTSVAGELEKCIALMEGPANRHAFVRNMADAARLGLASPALASGALAGLAVAVKDLFDIAGQSTLAGSRVLEGRPPAAADAPSVARLRAAGASLIGRTNMTEFAFSGIGVNPHHGTPAAWDGRYGQAVSSRDGLGSCIPGGSSSGSAVAVATGAAWVGLGSDTGGSIRIPAAFNGIVGFKGSAGLVPVDGAIPLSPTLDTVCAMTRSVRDAVLVHEILAARRVDSSSKPAADMRLAIARTMFQDDLDRDVAQAFERSIQAVSRSGAQIVEIDLPEVGDLRDLQANGGFTAAESFAWHRKLLQQVPGPAATGPDYDPRVRMRIERGANIRAWEYLELVEARRRWIAAIGRRLAGFDAVLSPTVPVVSPSIASVAPGPERDEQFFRVNTQVLRNTSVVNMFDGCAFSLPCHGPDEMPVGLMLWHGAGHDDALFGVALHVEHAIAG